MPHLKIGNELIPYKEFRNARYRQITLSILDDYVRISAPKSISARQLKSLLTAKQEWILVQWLKMKEASLVSRRHYNNGSEFPYRGRSLCLSIRRQACQSIQVNLEGQVLVVALPVCSADTFDPVNVQNSIRVWYKAQARQILKDKLDKQARRMLVSYQKFRLKDQRTRWGSCSSQGNINLNWRIIMAPDEVIDYLIIHELAHLTHQNHSSVFWQRVEKFMPEYRNWRIWLKEHGGELVL